MNLPKPFTHPLFLAWHWLPGGCARREGSCLSSPRPCQRREVAMVALPGPPRTAGHRPLPTRVWGRNGPEEKSVSYSLVGLYLISGVTFPFQSSRWRCHRQQGAPVAFGLVERGAGAPGGLWETRAMLHNTDTCRFRFHSHVLSICTDDLCRVVISVDFVYL